MSFTNTLISLYLRKNFNRVEMYKKYPDETQFKMFNFLIKKAMKTEFGKEFGFQDILKNGPSAFSSRVPLSPYENLKPYIEKVAKGEQNILWPQKTQWFAMSSGTTDDRSKYIPITKASLKKCHFDGGEDVLSVYLKQFPDTKAFTGKALAIGGSRQVNKLGEDIFCGDLSAVLISNLPSWVRKRRTPDIEIALMENWDKKIEAMAKAVSKEDVTSISGVPSWTLVLMRKILELTGKENISQVWPNLNLFMHGGVSFKPYRAQYEKLIPSEKMTYLETYNASEGFFAFQDDQSTDDMLLMLDNGIYYEFIPMSDFSKPDRQAVPLCDVKTGVNYAVVISTNGGLWRYIIGDTVEFTQVRPYKIKITGRTKHFINAFGEELVEDNASRAIRAASLATGADIKDYTAAPVYMETDKRGRHQWLIEFNILPNDMDNFVKTLDFELKRLNSDYDAKRYKDISLTEPEITVARENLFEDWLRKKGRIGGQNKIPRLENNRDIIDEMLEMNR
ncbi:MAG: GH3 auxin-responsive promoter family protein [Bacteroidales bacterium]|nr:GH3 auxin-responsive promoter family protein [Bacteroidales bacterium]